MARARCSSQGSQNRQEEPEWRREVRELVQRRFGQASTDSNSPGGRGYNMPTTSGWQRSEMPELDTQPARWNDHIPEARPCSPPSTSTVEQPASIDRILAPAAPSDNATTEELQSHIERLEGALKSADHRIHVLETQQSELQRALIQAVSESQELEISRLKGVNHHLKSLLEEAQIDKDTLREELRKGRTREEDQDRQLHQMNLEHRRLVAKAEILRDDTASYRTTTVPWTSHLQCLEHCLRGARSAEGSGRRRKDRGRGWDLPRGTPNKGWLP